MSDNVTNIHDKAAAFNPHADEGAFNKYQPLRTSPPPPPTFNSVYMGPLQAVTDELAKAVQVPPEVAALSLLCAAAIPAQAIHDVIIDGRVFPCSLFGLTILESGGRKSEVERHSTKPITELEKNLLDIEKQRLKNDPEHKAGDVQILSPDPTLEALAKSFDQGQKSQGLFGSEGGQFFGGHSMNKDNHVKSISGLSSFWDGAPVKRKRCGKGESAFICGCRLSMSLMVQPSIFSEACNNPLFRSQGFMGRLLIASPRSLRGSRTYNRIDFSTLKHLAYYHDRITALLGNGYANELTPTPLPLSSEAKEYWIDYYNQVEQLQAPNGRLAVIPEAASKAAENAARIACVLSTYDNSNSTDIHLIHMENACHLAQFFLETHLYLMAPQEEYEDQVQAHRLWDWIIQKKVDKGSYKFKWGDIPASGPGHMRNRHSLARSALATLVNHGYLRVTSFDSSGNANAWEVKSLETPIKF